MENFEISSDLSITGTKLMVDGKERTKKEKIVGISFYASSPTKDSEYDSGWVDLSITTVDEKDNVVTESFRKSEYMSKKVPMGQVLKDYLTNNGTDQIVRYIGHEVSKEKEEIADKIIETSEEKKIQCPTKEVLLNRTIDSLTDKAKDIGIELKKDTEDTEE
jgi:hypothetical protein